MIKKIIIVLLLTIPWRTYSSDFNLAIPLVLKHEGIIENDREDKGGITKYGISLQYIKRLVETTPNLITEIGINQNTIIDDSYIKNLSLNEAKKIYKKEWWDQFKYEDIKYQPLANKVFDISVNIGHYEAIKLLQESCNKLKNTHHLALNGKLDNTTVEWLNKLSNKESNVVLNIFKKTTSDYYQYLATKHPAYKKYLRGWIRRANE